MGYMHLNSLKWTTSGLLRPTTRLHQILYDTNYTGPSFFVWQNNLLTVPAPAVLGVGDPYWISQGLGNHADLAVSTNGGILTLAKRRAQFVWPCV